MFKRFVKVACCGLVMLVGPVYAQMDLEMPKPSEKKGMQSQSYGNNEEIKKLREMVKNNQPGAKPKDEAPPLSPPRQTENAEAGQVRQDAETPEGRVWKQYESIAGKKQAVKKENEPDLADDESENEDGSESGSDIGNILNQYKNRNKTELNSRSFARPEEVEKSLKAQSGQTSEETRAGAQKPGEELKAEKKKKIKEAVKSGKSAQPAKRSKEKSAGQTYNN